MVKLKAIFFDFDGVLIDSTPTKTAGFEKLFAEYDSDVVDRVLSYHRLHGGISRIEKIAYAHRELLGKPLTAEEVMAEGEKYSAFVLEEVIAAPWIGGAEDFLDRHNGLLPMFVISGTPHDELDLIVRRRGIADYFADIYGSPRKKPELVRNILRARDLEPENCVFIGDALTDYKTALETGMAFVGIQGDVAFPDGVEVLPDCTGLRVSLARHFIMPG